MISKLKKVLLQMIWILTPEELQLLDRLLHQRLAANTVGYAEHHHYAYWERLIDEWDTIPSPLRPSPGDVEIYRRFLGDAADGPVLILGSTPELRDLVAKDTNRRVYVADFSYRMPLAMLKFTSAVDPLKEVWLKGNWLELPFPPDFFGAVLGDLALQQLPPELEPALLEKIASLLKPHGLFISRCTVLDESVREGNLEALVQRILASPSTNWQKVHLLASRLLWRTADWERRALNRARAAQELSTFLNEKNLDHPLLVRVKRIIREEDDAFRHWSPPLEAALLEILARHFRLVARTCAPDYAEAGQYPVLALAKKSADAG